MRRTDEALSKEECFWWLSGWRSCSTHTIAGVFELCDQLLTTRLYTAEKTQTTCSRDVMCRLCAKAPESVPHILSRCSALAHNQYLSRYNRALKILFFVLVFGIDLIDRVPPLYYFHSGASMAATRSFGSVALLTFYAFTFLSLTRGPIQNRLKCLLRRPLGLFSTRTVFSSEAGLIFVVKLGGKFKLDLRSRSYFKSSFQVTKWTKHGSTSLHIPGHDLPLDITVFSDVSRNPGPKVLHFEPTTRTHADLHTPLQDLRFPIQGMNYSRSDAFPPVRFRDGFLMI